MYYNPLSLNLYTYVSNNPLIYVDPTGHEQMVNVGGGGSISASLPMPTETTEGGLASAAKSIASAVVGTVMTIIKVLMPKPEVSKPTQKQDTTTHIATLQPDVPVPDVPAPVQDASDHETLTPVQDVPLDYSTPLQQQDAPQVEQPVGKQDTPVVVAAGGTGETKIPDRGYHNETYASKPVKPQDATNKWDEFLGPGEHTNIHPRTGETDSDRIVSADGKRSIRYGKHEMNSSPTKHHYHEETWTHDSATNTMNVDNTVVRTPEPKR